MLVFMIVVKKTAIGHVRPGAAVNISCEVTPSTVKVNTVWTRDGVPVIQPGTANKFKLYNSDAILEITSYDPLKDAGTEQENKQLFCSKMCNNVCYHMYSSPLRH
ncbi:unnamed protein product [Nippostrongylus brasiliensis]|uniref:Ig-like domain-containing protein n=1 Tax=Nippostrongylus brasiliensis TaxID=27835 RepID=A0A0N4Y2S0_NIPBR|nr:unnamed protein product [Nippostrongylus brasiliensis]